MKGIVIAMACLMMAFIGIAGLSSASGASPSAVVPTTATPAAKTPTAQNSPTLTAAIAGTPVDVEFQFARNGQPVNTVCQFEYSLWDVPGGGTQQGQPIARKSKRVRAGLVQDKLDFGLAFNANARWLQVAAKCKGDRSFTVFPTRIELKLDGYQLTQTNLPSGQH